MVLKFYTSVTKKLKLKVRIFFFWRGNSYVGRSYQGKTGRGAFLPSPILNRVKDSTVGWVRAGKFSHTQFYLDLPGAKLLGLGII